MIHEFRPAPIPSVLYRAHHTSVDPLEPSVASGKWRWDDSRPDVERAFHVLYTADTIVGALIEMLQSFAGGDVEARGILDAITEDDTSLAAASRRVSPLRPRIVPASVLRTLAISSLEVIDPTKTVVDPFDFPTLQAIGALAAEVGAANVPVPLKAGDLLSSDYATCRSVATVIHDCGDADVVAGIVSRSSLDNPRDPNVHSNYSLFRALPKHGAGLRVDVRRRDTNLAMRSYPREVVKALRHLGAESEIPLDHPDLVDEREART